MMFPEFIYESFHYDVQSDGLHISFCFRLNDKLAFEPTAIIPSRPFLHPERLSKKTLDTLVFHIGMIELISYWKAYCSPTVVVKPFRLTDKQLDFWRKLYFNGLGEFFYTNRIEATMDDFMQFRCEGSSYTEPIADRLFNSPAGLDTFDTHLVPIGGGKDSVVTLEALSGSGPQVRQSTNRPLPLIMNPRGATVDCVARAGYTMDEVLVIKRTIHPLLLDLNRQGALNGHTPFSAMLAFYTLLASALTGCRPDIALSNENSANESTVSGSSVNHQYSKSLEFENDFRSYVADYLSKEFNYYSFLRPLSELQIAMLFAQQEKYFDVFKSCNVGSKTDVWCGHCAKCLFAYIILSPFIAPERLDAIFGKNMLDDKSLQLEFDQLTGHAETKPFECVGTVSEVNSALSMTLAKWYNDKRPALLVDYQPIPLVTPLDTLFAEHHVPVNDLEKLHSVLHGGDAVERVFRYRELFNLLDGKNILIAGYGREGKSSHSLLQRLFPTRRFDIAQNNEEIVAALKARDYDMILKSPGIPFFFFDGLCDSAIISSQSDLFLQLYGDHTVGVTGTKGKSTTTMVIYEALRFGGARKVVMAGNMGIPLFDIIPGLNDDTTIVAELSCHQLEGIHRAPHIGVILNLFQEHLDHYRSYEDYQMAKMQMGLQQREGDVLFYCGDNEALSNKITALRDRLRSQVVRYSGEDIAHDAIDWSGSKLKGHHNMTNCRVAGLVAQQFGVSQRDFSQVLSQIVPLEHRLEEVATVDGVTYINDSISTIPQATIEAVRSLERVDTLILGGFDRGIDYAPLVHFLCHSEEGRRIRNLVFWGSAGERIHEAFCQENDVPRNEQCHFGDDYSMREAVAFAAQNSCKGHICLLSPAASSYDHYKNFEYRGRDFKECVNSLVS